MRKLNKTLIIIGTLICFIFSIAFADSLDCQFFENHIYNQNGAKSNGFDIVNQIRETDNYPYTNFLTVEQQKAIITKDDLNTALLNLKKYCCSKDGGLSKTSQACEKDKTFFNDNVIDSEYLFDHLFDVIMRRLSGLSGLDGDENIYTKTNMTLDDKGFAWRQWINNQAISIEGSSPQVIIDKYREFWQKSPSNSGYDISQSVGTQFKVQSFSNFLDYVKGGGKTSDSESISSAMKKYNERTLYDRYINACALTEYFYALLALTTEDKQGYSTKDSLIKGNVDNLCNNIVLRQITGENNYVSSVIQSSFNLYLSNYMEGYTKYLYDRQLRFQSLFKEAKNRWLDIVRAVPCLQHKCVG